MRLVTCHTPLYTPLAERCAASFARFGLEVERVLYAGRASGPAAWKTNTLLKVIAFRRHVQEPVFEEGAVWLLDADVQAVADPTEPLRCALDGFDMAVPFAPPGTRDAKDRDTQVSAGCVGFAGREGARSLSLWAGKCAGLLAVKTDADLAARTLWEQLALVEAVEESERGGLRVNHLPPNFGMRPDLVKAAGLAPMLEHVPASGAQQMKKKVGSPNCPKGA